MFKQLVALTLLGLAFSAPSSKIAPGLTKSLHSQQSVNIIVRFGEGHWDILRKINSQTFSSREEKAGSLVAALKKATNNNQKNALNLLATLRQSNSAVAVTELWVTNEVYVKGATAALISQLESLPEVTQIREESVLQLGAIIPEEDIVPQAEWNLDRIEAEKAWALPGGNNGRGAVVASLDTGVRYTHETVQRNYRAKYGWFDPYDRTSTPSDGIGLGTFITGVMAGAGVGVAPGAQWISCRGCSSSSCTEAALIACGQWVICPTLPDGSNEDCTQSPRVVTNSWGGGQNSKWFDLVIELWKSLDIIPVFSAGNGGPRCGSISYPADSQSVLTVSGTNADDALASGSGAGPTSDGRIKPELCAPAVSVRSGWSTSDDAYLTLSSTVVGVPHVAGAAALLISRDPSLTYAQVKELLEQNTDKSLKNTGEECGGIPSNVFPNNQYGHGRLNARKALEAAINRNETFVN